MVLYIDDIESNLALFQAQFRDQFPLFTAISTREAYRILTGEEIKVVVTDQKMPEESGIDFIGRVKDKFPDVVCMILTAFDDFEIAKNALNSGLIYRFHTKPWDKDAMQMDIMNAAERYDLYRKNQDLVSDLKRQNKELKALRQKLEGENMYLRSEIKLTKNIENIISEDSNFLHILNRIEMIASADTPVLITGETGTGKELIARAIHNLSERRQRAFISVNCAAIPESLLESELFGHEKGAFTGAIQRKKGRFELAQDGTLFLDEIGEIPISMQPKLLRAIEQNSIERLGGQETIKLDIRILCATNKDLREEVKNNKFRSDLFYRINLFHVELPPLRDRGNDIPILVDHFVTKYNRKYKKSIRKIPRKKLQYLKAYPWPGNVRELENIIERAVILSEGEELILELDSSFAGTIGGTENSSDKLAEVEREHIQRILERTSWKIGGRDGAAEILGLNRTTLLARMKKLNISRSF